jgi:hypothetical protein
LVYQAMTLQLSTFFLYLVGYVIIMSEKGLKYIQEVTKQLYKLNLVSVALASILWVSSVWYALTMGVKYGLTYEVTTVIGDIERVTTQNTIFNVIMSGAFTWMFLTASLSALYLITMSKANEGGQDIE